MKYLKTIITHVGAFSAGALIVFAMLAAAMSQSFKVDTKFGKVLCFPPSMTIQDE